jgi:hypothetical protein
MKISKRMKIAALAACLTMAVALVVFIAFMVYVGSDTLSSRATDSEALKPDGTVIGKALVVYNPGLSGAPKDAAIKIASDLKSKGYETTLAGVKSAVAVNVSGYDVIVAGGPIYGGKVSPSVYSYLQVLAPPEDAHVGPPGRTVDGEVAEDGHVEAVQVMVGVGHRLGGLLRGGVR